VVVVLDRRALEPTLPDVAEGPVPLVVAPGVRHQERLHDATDGHPRLGAEQEVEVVGHQAIAVEPERVAELRPAEGVEEGAEIAIVVEDGVAIVAPAEGMEGQAIVNRSQGASHAPRLPGD